MRRTSPFGTHRVLWPVLVGCLLGAATIGGTLASGALAVAAPRAGLAAARSVARSCATHHTNVEGSDKGNNATYGQKGYIYINTSTTLGNLQDDIFRTYSEWGPPGWNVEFGWGDGPDFSGPTVISDYEMDGHTANAQSLSYSLTDNTDVRFRIENIGLQYIWRYVVDGQSTPIGYSPTMNFNYGTPHTNSEHYNNCDSMWTHMWNLSYSNNVPPNWSSSFSNLQCYLDDSINDWLFDKISNQEEQVNETNGVTC
jgi:hypothetical protein